METNEAGYMRKCPSHMQMPRQTLSTILEEKPEQVGLLQGAQGEPYFVSS